VELVGRHPSRAIVVQDVLLWVPVVAAGVAPSASELRAPTTRGQSNILQLRLVEALEDIVATVEIRHASGCGGSGFVLES